MVIIETSYLDYITLEFWQIVCERQLALALLPKNIQVEEKKMLLVFVIVILAGGVKGRKKDNVFPRETEEGWPLPTEAKWDSTQLVHMEGILPWLVCWAHRSGTRDLLSCLRCSSRPSTKYFFLTELYFISFVPIAQEVKQAVVPRRLSQNKCLW
jgi:hypothetical protein